METENAPQFTEHEKLLALELTHVSPPPARARVTLDITGGLYTAGPVLMVNLDVGGTKYRLPLNPLDAEDLMAIKRLSRQRKVPVIFSGPEKPKAKDRPRVRVAFQGSISRGQIVAWLEKFAEHKTAAPDWEAALEAYHGEGLV